MCNPNRELPHRLWSRLGIIAACLFLSPMLTQALPEDREQPIRITADQALRDEKQGVTIYTGNVKLTQGSLKIDSDKLTIYHGGQDLDRIVAEGTPANLEQRPDPDKGLMKARARSITYYQLEDRIHLQQEAQIEQDGNIVTGNSIDYFIEKELVRADSTGDSNGRVQVVIPPQNIPQEEQDSGTTDSE